MEDITCPECTGSDVAKNGKSAKGEQRYLCKDEKCHGKSFKLEYIYNGWKPGIDQKILSVRAENSTIRDIAGELGLSKQKVQETLRELQHQLDCLCKVCKNYEPRPPL